MTDFADPGEVAALGAFWTELRKLGFAMPEHRTEAMTLYLRSRAMSRQNEAWHLLSTPGPGPAIRLWRLRQLLEEQVENA